MELTILKSEGNGFLKNIRTFSISFILILMLELSSIYNADAQREGRIILGLLGHMGHAGRIMGEGRRLPFWRFSILPRIGANFLLLPPLSARFLMGGIEFYFYDGIYYRHINGSYTIVPAPLGYRVSVLPKDCFKFFMGSTPFYYYYGAFYTTIDGKYEVVPAPIGAEVPGLPDGYEKIVADGQTFYIFNNVQYTKVIRDNQTWYLVVKNNSNTFNPDSPPQQDQNNQTAPIGK